MQLVIVNGSPHGLDGNTGKLIRSFRSAAEEQGAAVETLNLSDYTVHPCRGCEVCSKTGTCVIDDDAPKLQQKFLAADGIVLASPNYMMNVSGQLKVFLDRIFSHVHCQTLYGKYGAALVTAAGPVFEGVEEYLMSIFGFLGCWKVGSIGAASLQLEDPDECSRMQGEAADLARRFVEAIKNGETFPDQEEKRSQVFEMMKMMVQAKQDAWAYEYRYWKTNWGIEEE